MAERIVSPGVFTRENDLSFLAQGVGEIGAAFIGPFKQGPAFVPTIVRTQSEFEDIFGTPDGTYYTEYAVQNYLREAGSATIVRVGGIGGYQQTAPIGIFASGGLVGEKLIGVLYSTEAGDEAVGFGIPNFGMASTASGPGFASGSFVLSSSFGIVSASILETATNDVADTFGTSPFGAKTAYTYAYFKNIATTNYTNAAFGAGGVEGGTYVSASALPAQVYGDISAAETPYVKSQKDNNNVRYDLFKFVT